MLKRDGAHKTVPIVALLGRPNVGKSTLFNRLMGKRIAVVEDFPGTTRDRIYGELEWRGRTLALVDTAGIAWHDPSPVAAAAVVQAELAAEEADLLLVVTDAQTGIVDLDQAVARRVLRSGRPYILVVNKADGDYQRQETGIFVSLGLGDPQAISALHGTATGGLLDAIIDLLPAVAHDELEDEHPRVAIVGRPNAGKSSLLNTVLGEQRALVHESPGTTRDSIDTLVEWDGTSLWLVDTAGMRRRGRIQPGVERHSVLRAVRSTQRADVAILVVDAHEGPTAQDAHIAGLVLDAATGVVVAANKWDLLDDPDRRGQVERNLERLFHFLPESPVIRTSALSGRNVQSIIPAALKVVHARQTRITTSHLNRFLRDWIGRRDPPSHHGRQSRFKYATQVGVSPPTFLLFFSAPNNVHATYLRYLENGLRETFDFDGTPIEIRTRQS